MCLYQNFRDDMNDRYQKAQEDGVMTDKEQTNWVQLDEIDAFIAEMNNNIKTGIIEGTHLWACDWTRHPIRTIPESRIRF